MCLITGGHSVGRVGTILHREKHPGSYDIVYVKNAAGRTFGTRLNNIFIIGEANKTLVSLPKGNGVRETISELRDRRLANKQRA